MKTAMLTFETIIKIGHKFDRPASDEFSRLEALLQVPLPPGYTDFFGTFGVGDIASWVRIFPPAQIALEREAMRERIAQDFHWHADDAALTREQIESAVVVGDTFSDDLILWHAPTPSGLFLLPAAESEIASIGTTITRALDWLCQSGGLTGRIDPVWFQSWANRGRTRFTCTDTDFLAVRGALADMALHDAVLFDTVAESAADAILAERAKTAPSTPAPLGPPLHEPDVSVDDDEAAVGLYCARCAGTIFCTTDEAPNTVMIGLEFDMMKENGISAKVKGELEKRGFNVRIRQLLDQVPYRPTTWPTN